MQIIPAILTNDSMCARQQLDILRGHAPWIQIDVMDGDFVSNTSFELSDLTVDDLNMYKTEIHLMVKNPENYFPLCSLLGVARVIIHYEAVHDLKRTLGCMAESSFLISVAINPDTEEDALLPYIDLVDSVLIMSVIPGKQGQSFMNSVLYRASFFKKQRPGLIVGIDGGVNITTLPDILNAHFDYAGVGSAIFSSDDPLRSYGDLQLLATGGHHHLGQKGNGRGRKSFES